MPCVFPQTHLLIILLLLFLLPPLPIAIVVEALPLIRHLMSRLNIPEGRQTAPSPGPCNAYTSALHIRYQEIRDNIVLYNTIVLVEVRLRTILDVVSSVVLKQLLYSISSRILYNFVPVDLILPQISRFDHLRLGCLCCGALWGGEFPHLLLFFLLLLSPSNS